MSNIMESKVYILRVNTWIKLIALHLMSGAWALFCFKMMSTKKQAAICAGLFFIITAVIIMVSIWPERRRLKILLVFCFLQSFVFGLPLLVSAFIEPQSLGTIKILKNIHQLSELNYMLILARLTYQGLYKKLTAPIN